MPQALGHAAECPPTPRTINMNRIGAALNGEANDPPIKSLFVFCANPVASSPNASLIVKGLQREDLFTVVHDLFMTDTADYADIVLPATSQLEQVDLHKAYGHRNLQYNHAAIAPLGEAKSNWDTMRLLARALGYDEPWLHESAEDAIRGVLDATRAKNPHLAGITLERLQAEGTVALHFPPGDDVPFADGRFPTPSGKVELYCAAMIAEGLDPLPTYVVPAEFVRDEGRTTKDEGSAMPSSSSVLRPSSLVLISGASHHFISSSFANQPSLMAKEGHAIRRDQPGRCGGARDQRWRSRDRRERARLVSPARGHHRRCAAGRGRCAERPVGAADAGWPQHQLDDIRRAGGSGRAEHVSQQPGGDSAGRAARAA